MLRRVEGLRRPWNSSARGAVGFALLAFVAQSACGSEAEKKKVGPQYHSGGDDNGGESAAAGSDGYAGKAPVAGGNSEGGMSADGGASTAGKGGGGSANVGGEATGSGGDSSLAGAGGQAGAPGTQCEPGTADCDDDPSDCEANVTLLSQCGECGVSCQSTNGTVICGDTGCEMTSCDTGFGDCNDSGTDGCETDLKTSANCGICSHSCGTAACTNGLCASTALGSSVPAYRWTTTADAIYRIDAYTPSYGVGASYSLIRTPLDGGAEVVMASGGPIGGLTVDADNVYWGINGTPPAVLKKAHGAPAATGPTGMFEPVSLPVQLQIRGSAMYWTALDGQIYTRAMNAVATDPGSMLVSAADVKGSGTFNLHQDFVTTPTMMYWVVLPTSGNQAFIRGAGLNGQNVADVAGSITNSFFKIWTKGEDLYWIRATGAALDGVYHYTKGGTVESLVIQSGLNAVLADTDYLFLGQGSNTLLRVPLAGGTPVKIGSGTVMDFAKVDSKFVYGLMSFTHGGGFTGGAKIAAFPK